MLSYTREAAKILICPLTYLITFFAGNIIVTSESDNLQSPIAIFSTVALSSEMMIAALLLFVFLSMISLIGLKLAKKFDRINNAWLLLFWGMMMGIISVFVLLDFQINPIIRLFRILF